MGVTNATVAGGDTQQVPVQLARGGLVAVTAAISVPSDAWAELMLALTCWETHGMWVEVATERFVWTPNASVCPPYYTYPEELPKLDALHLQGRARGSRALLWECFCPQSISSPWKTELRGPLRW